MGKCSSDCIYFPEAPSLVKEVSIDEFGLKHRKAVFTCGYDFHILEKFDNCDHCIEFKNVKNYQG